MLYEPLPLIKSKIPKNTMKTKEMGGTKHFKYKTQKIKFYRKAISNLKKKRPNTKTLKTKKQHKLSYLKSKLRTLTSARSHSRKNSKTHTRARIRARTQKKSPSPTALETIEWNTQKYTSPRIVPILNNGSLSIPPIQSPPPMPSPLPLNENELQPSPNEMEVDNTVKTVNISPITNEITLPSVESPAGLSIPQPPPFPEIATQPTQVSVAQPTTDESNLLLNENTNVSSSSASPPPPPPPSNNVNTQQNAIVTNPI